jgi:RNA polymerase sigma-70 factor, ECF subfamily
VSEPGGRREEPRLAAGLRRGDAAAMEAIYALHAPAVLGFLSRVIGDRHAAEDVLQEVFVEAWRGGARFDPSRSGLSTWLIVIARSRAIDHLRRRIPEPRDASAQGSPFEQEDPTSQIDGLMDKFRFAERMRSLPMEDARILKMRFHLGLTQSEIAEQTGMPLGTVKTKMNRSLARLRRAMDDDGDS